MTTSPMTIVLDHLEGVAKSGSSFVARCPGHPDKNPSLSIDEGDDGRVLLHCHAGCDTATILAGAKLEITDLFPVKAANGNGTGGGEIIATYPYVDENGVLLFEVFRKTGKKFVQRRPDGKGGWVWNTKGVRRVLFNLPDVIAAVAAEVPVYVVEGEKDALAIGRAGEVATCNPAGAGKWSPEFAEFLRGGHVIIVVDQDPPGIAHAADVEASLVGVAASVRVVAPATGKDASDHLAAGHGLEELVGEPEPDIPAIVPEGGAVLLDEVAAFIRRFVALPSEHSLIATVLWTAHTHALDCFDSTARLALLSPEPGSGKTRTLEVLDVLVPRAMHALNASAPPIFRSIETARPTLLFDEVDALWGSRGKDDSAEDLRALLNAGHRRGATIPRCVGPRHEVTLFPVYAACALAGLGDLPDTLMSRSIIVRMRRRAPHEQVESFRYRAVAPEGHQLRDRLARWAKASTHLLDGAWPVMPEGVSDRPADTWEALLAIADAAGGHWPTTARAACVELCKVVESREASLGVRLLGDLREIFGEEDRLSTEVILSRLHALEEAPWSDLRGKPLDPRGLARRLTSYGVRSTKVKIGDASLRGYRREDLWDPWTRYLSPSPGEAERPEPTEPGRSEHSIPVPLSFSVPEPPAQAEPEPTLLTCEVPQVPQVPDLTEGKEA